MKPSKIAHDLALMRYARVLIRRKVPASEAEELANAVNEIVQAALHILRAEIEHERDETRRRFYEVHPELHPERGHMPHEPFARPIAANVLRIEAITTQPGAAHLDKQHENDLARSPSVARAVP